MFEGPNNPKDNQEKMNAIFSDGEKIKTGKMVDGKEVWDGEESFTEEELVKKIQEARTIGDRANEQELLKRLQIFDKKKEAKKTEEIDPELAGDYEMADRQQKGDEQDPSAWEKASTKKEEKAAETKLNSEKEEKKTTEEKEKSELADKGGASKPSREALAIDRIMRGDTRSDEAVKIDEIMGRVQESRADNLKEKEKAADELKAMEDGVEGSFKNGPRPEALKPEEREAQLMARFELLDNELKSARREYVVRDYNMDKNSSLMKKFFGFGKRAQLGEFNQEYEQARERYNATMSEYKSVMLELMGDQEGAKITSDWIEKGEYLNLKNTRTDVKMENSPLSEKIKGYALKLAEDYRKLPMWKKMVMGATLAGVGLASGVAGGVAAAGGAAFLSGMRIFTTGVSAVGFKGMFEGIAEKSRSKKAEAASQENLKKNTNERGEIDFSRLNESLNRKILGIDGELQSRKNWEKRRTWMAVGSAAAVTMIGRYVGEKASEWLNGGGTPGAGEIQPGINHLPDNLRDINIPKGSSFEGALGKHLQLMGMNAEEAGKKAHLMALEYAKEHGFEKGPFSLVHEGAHIQLSSDGTKVLNITDAKGLGWLKEQVMNPSSHTPAPESIPVDQPIKPELPAVEPEQIRVEPIKPELPAESAGTPRIARIEDFYKPDVSEGSDYIGTIDRIQDDINSQIASNQEELTRSYTHSAEEIASINERIEMLTNRGGGLNNLQEAMTANLPEDFTGTRAQVVGSAIRQMIFEENSALAGASNGFEFSATVPEQLPEINQLGWREADNLKSTIAYLREIGGEKAIPKSGESMHSWVQRVANLLSK